MRYYNRHQDKLTYKQKEIINQSKQIASFDKYWLWHGMWHTHKNIQDTKGESYRVTKRRVFYLKKQIILHYFKNFFLFPLFLIKFLLPSFMKGKNNVWINIKTIIKEKEFKPLRIAILSQFVFILILTQLSILVYQYYTNPSRTATMFLTQTNWGGGASTTLFAIHPTNLTNWTNFYSTSSIAVNTTVSGQVSITPTLSSTTQTSDADFSAWSKSSNVYVPTGGNKITLLKPDGASCTTGTQCSSGICTGNLCVPPPCAYATSLVYSGETYPLKELGTQCWFAKNLNVGTMLAAGTTMPSNNSLIEKWCYGNNSFNCTVWYGALYTWAEANQFDPGCNTSSCTASSTPNQGICPSGWHIPTDAEFKTLESYLGMCAGAGIGCVDAIGERGGGIGTKLKSGGSSGFNLLLGGYRSTAGDFSWNNYYGKLWSASQYDASQGWYRSVDSSQDKVYRNGVNKVFGHSVRCLKN